MSFGLEVNQNLGLGKAGKCGPSMCVRKWGARAGESWRDAKRLHPAEPRA